jgi:hypothetical protein
MHHSNIFSQAIGDGKYLVSGRPGTIIQDIIGQRKVS